MQTGRFVYVLLFCSLLSAGCSPSLSFRYGRMPAINLAMIGGVHAEYGRMPPIETSLSALAKGKSDKGDVLRVLGPPGGYGMARFASGSAPQVIWHYEYLETREKSFTTRILMVFFDREKYDGYLWFSSYQELTRE